MRWGFWQEIQHNHGVPVSIAPNQQGKKRPRRTKKQYVKASGDLKKLTAFTVLHISDSTELMGFT
jgi:hypothetical protein